VQQKRKRGPITTIMEPQEKPRQYASNPLNTNMWRKHGLIAHANDIWILSKEEKEEC
jgi:hypothetical protein